MCYRILFSHCMYLLYHFSRILWNIISAYRLVKPGWAASFALKFRFLLITFFNSQPIYFILTHIIAYIKTFSPTCRDLGIQMTLMFNIVLWQIVLKFIVNCSVITFSLVDRFTLYSHTMLHWSILLHWCATFWPLNDLAIESLKVVFTYKDLAMYFFNMSIFERLMQT